MAKKKRYPSAGRTNKRPHKVAGGPLNGHKLYLSCPGTLTFTMNGQRGRYNEQNVWVES